MEWRLIVLESFAGVPGFMAAMFRTLHNLRKIHLESRHFRCLRTLQRDHGWIHTLCLGFQALFTGPRVSWMGSVFT